MNGGSKNTDVVWSEKIDIRELLKPRTAARDAIQRAGRDKQSSQCSQDNNDWLETLLVHQLPYSISIVVGHEVLLIVLLVFEHCVQLPAQRFQGAPEQATTELSRTDNRLLE